MRRILAAAGWLCLGLAPLSAAESTTPALPLDKLVEQLGDANFRVREAAGKAIEARGIAILPELRTAAAASPSAEARRRLQSLVGQMERAAALEPKWVTLKCKDQSVANVLADLAKQTGYQLVYQGGGNAGTLTYNLERVTFWQAIDRVCDDAHLYVYHNENSGLQLYHQDNYWPHVAYNGPFKLTANSLNFNKSVTLGGLPRNPAPGQAQNRSESLQFAFNVMSEPKLPIMSVSQARVLEATDELGNSMTLPANPHETYYNNGGYKSFNQSLYVQLAWPNKEAKFVKRVRVSVPLMVLASQKPEIVVDDILKVKDKKFLGATADIHVIEAKEVNKTQYQIKLTVRNTASNAGQDYNWINSIYQRLELHDAKGNKYGSQGISSSENNSPGQVQATFQFGNNGNAALGPPVKLVYIHWALMQHQIDVEFKDLPLP
jgi:hypothetical protein